MVEEPYEFKTGEMYYKIETAMAKYSNSGKNSQKVVMPKEEKEEEKEEGTL